MQQPITLPHHICPCSFSCLLSVGYLPFFIWCCQQRPTVWVVLFAVPGRWLSVPPPRVCPPCACPLPVRSICHHLVLLPSLLRTVFESALLLCRVGLCLGDPSVRSRSVAVAFRVSLGCLSIGICTGCMGSPRIIRHSILDLVNSA